LNLRSSAWRRDSEKTRGIDVGPRGFAASHAPGRIGRCCRLPTKMRQDPREPEGADGSDQLDRTGLAYS